MSHKSIELAGETRLCAIEKAPEDLRDHVVGSTVYSDEIQIPNYFDLRPKLMPVRNQGSTSQCAAFSSACIKEYHESLDVGRKEYMSTEYIYTKRENQDSEGMHLRDVMKILQKSGTCLESSWKFRSPKPNESLDYVNAEARNHTISHYARCNSVHDLKKAIYVCGPCIGGLPVYDKRTNRDAFWRPESSDDKLVGYHAITFVGYNKDEFIIRNSWGKSWSQDGYVEMPITDFHLAFDIYCCYDERSDKNFEYIKDRKDPKPTPVNPDNQVVPKKKKGCGCIIC